MVRMNSRWVVWAVVFVLASTLLCSCGSMNPLASAKADKTPTDIDVKNFGKTPEGEQSASIPSPTPTDSRRRS